MCLVLFGIDTHPDIPLILAANRDEFYTRPTAPMTFWDRPPKILAGRDLEAGGTWMGISESGRFAALTNVRDLRTPGPASPPTRGEIIPALLSSGRSIPLFLQDLDRKAKDFNGFNLIAGQGSAVFWYSNRDRRIVQLPSGVHGLSNHLMDTPWPKVERGKQKLARCIETAPRDDTVFFDLLQDRHRPEDRLLPDTGIGQEWERILSPMFIRSPTYGTRSSTLMRITASGKILVTERTYIMDKTEPGEGSTGLRHEDRRFTITPPS